MPKHARFWRADWWEKDMGHRVSWHRLKREALAAAAQGDGSGPSDVQPVVIHLSTDSLLRWLNVYFMSDND